jgi:hypothetical protein
MTNKRVELGERLFDDYSRNLSYYHPHLENIFICPLCLQPFNKNAIQSGELTIEHLIPAGLGGKLVTLTCKECNSKSGHQLDAHLIRRMRFEDIMAGQSDQPLRIRIKVGEGEFGGDLFLSNDTDPNIQIIGIKEISNPMLHELALDEFDAGQKNISIHGNLGYKEIHSRVAALRIAYLLMFRFFGYGYILYDNLFQVRKQIFHPEEETNVLKSMFWVEDTPKRNIIAVLQKPSELRCFQAIIDLSTNIKRCLCIVLPGPDPASENIYERWSTAIKLGKVDYKPKMDLIYYDPAYLTDLKFKFLPARIWRNQVAFGREQIGKG